MDSGGLLDIDTTGLKSRQLDGILKSTEYKTALRRIAKNLRDEAPKVENESTIEARFDQYLTLLFDKLFSSLGFNYKPTKEKSVDTVRAVTKGHADTTEGNVVIEFKQWAKLLSEKDRQSAFEQVMDYVDGFNKKGDIKTFAMVTDGYHTLTRVLGSIWNKSDTTIEYEPLNEGHLDTLVRALLGLGQKSLTPEHLVEDFAEDDTSPTRRLASQLYRVLTETPSAKTRMLLSEWKHLFQLSHDDVASQQQDIKKRCTALEQCLGEELLTPDDEYNALFALQTSYTVLIKLLAFKAVSQVKEDEGNCDFGDLADNKPEELRRQMELLESGEITRNYGIHNLLEGDYFSWYAASNQWNSEIATEISRMVSRLNVYQTHGVFSSEERTQDFFKILYHKVMPKEVRHSLGEYYTPTWLANRTVERALNLLKQERGGVLWKWRALDPTCGSGTFISCLIDKVIKENPSLSGEDMLREITTRVVGIDMNPLAALTARVNYFLNIARFISFSSSIDIPVYTGDSAYVPTPVEEQGEQFLEYSLDTEKGPLSLRFPVAAMSDLGNFSETMNEIEYDIKLKSLEGVTNRLRRLLPADKRDNEAINEALEKTAATFIEFEKNDWNGIWARVAANYLTTSEIGSFDIIVGNPPWVDWKNLPSQYRNRIKSLSITDTIFSGDGFSGGINLNIAALITNVSMDKWLVPNGILGMLMPDTFLKQRTYEGYRRLVFSNHTHGAFLAFDDWTKAGQPFDHVSQKFLGYYIARKGNETESALPVTSFKKKPLVDVSVERLELSKSFDVTEKKAIRPSSMPNRTNLVICDSRNAEAFRLVGRRDAEYIGREGMRFFPRELMLFELIDVNDGETILVRNVRNSKAQHRVPQQHIRMESSALRPLVQGKQIQPFHVEWDGIYVPFPYKEDYSTRKAIPEQSLHDEWPCLYRYYALHKDVFQEQSKFSSRLVMADDAPFYSIARAGDYRFAPRYVVFRSNSRCVAAVVEKVDTPWGPVQPAFQDHAPTISQRPDGSWLSVEEADYIAGIINCDVVCDYVSLSADLRSIPINPPRYQIPLYGQGEKSIIEKQRQISELSKQARQQWNDTTLVNERRTEISRIYLDMLREIQ